jgi:hypothetical protein
VAFSRKLDCYDAAPSRKAAERLGLIILVWFAVDGYRVRTGTA